MKLNLSSKRVLFAGIYLLAMTLLILCLTYTGIANIPYDIISNTAFVISISALLLTLLTSSLILGIHKKPSPIFVSTLIALPFFSSILTYCLYDGAIPKENARLERLFNIPIGAQITDENIKTWSSKYPDKVFQATTDDASNTTIQIIPNSLVGKKYLSEIEKAKIVTLRANTDENGIINEIVWMKNAVTKGRPKWENISDEMPFNIWLRSSPKTFWDGRFVLEEGRNRAFLRLYDADLLIESDIKNEKHGERLGRAKLHKMFGE